MRNFVISTAAVCLAAPLQAGTPTQPVTATVTIADLNLATRHGQHLLTRRVAEAVEQVCGSYANAPELVDQERIGSCRSEAMSSARRYPPGSTTVRLSSGDAPITETIDTTISISRRQEIRQDFKHRINYVASWMCAEVSSATPAPASVNPECFRDMTKNALAQMDRAVARANIGQPLAAASPVSTAEVSRR